MVYGEGEFVKNLITVSNVQMLLAYSIQCDHGERHIIPSEIVNMYYDEICKKCQEITSSANPTFKSHKLWKIIEELKKKDILTEKHNRAIDKDE